MNKTLTYKIIKSRDCGLEVFRILIWEDAALVHLSTHMSREAAMTKWIAFRALSEAT